MLDTIVGEQCLCGSPVQRWFKCGLRLQVRLRLESQSQLRLGRVRPFRELNGEIGTISLSVCHYEARKLVPAV